MSRIGVNGSIQPRDLRSIRRLVNPRGSLKKREKKKKGIDIIPRVSAVSSFMAAINVKYREIRSSH